MFDYLLTRKNQLEPFMKKKKNVKISARSYLRIYIIATKYQIQIDEKTSIGT